MCEESLHTPRLILLHIVEIYMTYIMNMFFWKKIVLRWMQITDQASVNFLNSLEYLKKNMKSPIKF